MKPGAIYDIVLTQPADLNDTEIESVNHPWCIYEKCEGMNRNDGRKVLREIAINEFYYWLSEDQDYEGPVQLAAGVVRSAHVNA